MKLGLLLLALLSTTQLFGYFQYGGFLRSQSFVFRQSGNLVISDMLASEIWLRRNLHGTKTIFDYKVYLSDSNGEPETLHITRWMIDQSTHDILHINDTLDKELRASYWENIVGRGDSNKGKIPSQTEVIGQRFEPSIESNFLGAPLVIEADGAKLIVTSDHESGIITVYGEKTLEDGRVIKWKDELRYGK